MPEFTTKGGKKVSFATADGRKSSVKIGKRTKKKWAKVRKEGLW